MILYIPFGEGTLSTLLYLFFLNAKNKNKKTVSIPQGLIYSPFVAAMLLERYAHIR